MKSILIKHYLLRSWLLVLIVTPLLCPLVTIFYGVTNWKQFPIFWIFSVLYGLVFSLPSFIICLLIYKLIINRVTSIFLIKLATTSGALICMLATIYLWYGPFGYTRDNNYMSLSLSILYSTTIILFGLLVPLRRITAANSGFAKVGLTNMAHRQ